MLSTIQALRGAAALAVVACHASTMLGSPWGGALRAGHAGVDVFFVLSGFVIATAHGIDIGQPRALPHFAWKRLIRVCPAYWIVTCAVAALGPDPVDPGRILTSLALVPQPVEPILAVAWTLQHEMLFYLMFLVLIASRTAGCIAFGAWFLLVAAMLPAPLDAPWAHARPFLGTVASSYNLQFGLGVVVAWAVARRGVQAPRLLAFAGTAGIVLTAWAEDAGAIAYLGQAGRALFGLSAAALIAGLAAAERAGRLRGGAGLTFLGSASYSIYLVHTPLLTAVLSAVRLLPVAVALAALTLVGIAGGIAFHLAIDRPALRWFRRLGSGMVGATGIEPVTPTVSR